MKYEAKTTQFVRCNQIPVCRASCSNIYFTDDDVFVLISFPRSLRAALRRNLCSGPQPMNQTLPPVFIFSLFSSPGATFLSSSPACGTSVWGSNSLFAILPWFGGSCATREGHPSRPLVLPRPLWATAPAVQAGSPALARAEYSALRSHLCCPLGAASPAPISRMLRWPIRRRLWPW